MKQPIVNNGVPFAFDVQLGVARLFEQGLCFLGRGLKTNANAQKAVPGGNSTPGKYLVEINLADVGAPGQSGFGDVFFLVELGEKLG